MLATSLYIEYYHCTSVRVVAISMLVAMNGGVGVSNGIRCYLLMLMTIYNISVGLQCWC